MNKICLLFLIGLVPSLFAAEMGQSSLDKAMDISTTALIVQRTKIEVHAHNIANLDTTRTSDGGPYRRKRVQIQSVGNAQNPGGVEIKEIYEDPSALSRVYDPGHPDADPQGYVYYPNIDLASELVEMSRTASTFETNAIVFNNAKQMMQSTLDIGK